MRTNRLLLLSLAVGSIDLAMGCNSGDGAFTGGGAVADTSIRGDSPGFGSPGAEGTRQGSVDPSGFAPGFGAPAGNGGVNPAVQRPGAGTGFSPGFGAPGARGSASVPGGGGTPPPGGGVGTGLPSSTRLSDLTASQAEQLCEAIEDAAFDLLRDEDALRVSCTLIALAQSLSGSGGAQVDVEACEQRVEQCLDDLGAAGRSVECSPTELRAGASECPATVGDLERCLDASLSRSRQLASVVSCDISNPAELQGLLGTSNPVTECEALDEQCPDVLDLASGDSGGGVPGGTAGGGAGVGGGQSGSGGSAGSGGAAGSGGTRCTDTCRYPADGDCDDGGPDSVTNLCELGTDCTDCGPR